MGKKAFIAAFVCVFLALSTVVTVAYGQSTPKPTIPEFSLQVANSCVQMKIQNQPYNSTNPYGILCYDIRIKHHNETAWTELTAPDPSKGVRGYIGEIGTSGYTTIQTPFDSINSRLGWSYGSQIDYQIQAIDGILNITYSSIGFGADPNTQPVIMVDTSGWSNTQTIAMPEKITPSPISTQSASPSPSLIPSTSPIPPLSQSPNITPSLFPTQTPTIEHSPIPNNTKENLTKVAVIAGLAVGIIIVALLAYGAKRKGWK